MRFSVLLQNTPASELSSIVEGQAVTATLDKASDADITIYHNPNCGTSRNALAMIRNAGIEPHVVEYLKTPPSRPLLKQLISRMGVSVRDLLREKGTPFGELGLNNPELSEPI